MTKTIENDRGLASSRIYFQYCGPEARSATPIIGGMITSTIHVLIITPVTSTS